MVDFMNGYEAPMDRQFDEQPIDALEEHDIETPIIPISELGTTVVDSGQGNILQNLEQNIRVGTKKIQLVIAGGTAGPSQLAASFGKDIRRELKERAKVSGVKITGVELSPQRVQGLTGFNPQSGGISEEQRHKNIKEVQDAVEFAADVAGGGGVDIYSNEFQRDIVSAKWNEEGKDDIRFFNYSNDELKDPTKSETVKYLIDERTGQPIQGSVIRTKDKIHRVKFITAEDEGVVGEKDANGRVLQKGDFIDVEGNYVDPFNPEQVTRLVPKIKPDTKEFESDEWDWNRVLEETEKYNKTKPKEDRVSPEQFAYRVKLLGQMAQMHGQHLYYNQNMDLTYEQLKETARLKKFAEEAEKNMSEEARARWIEDNLIPLILGGRGTARGVPDAIKEQLKKKMPSEVVKDILIRQQNEFHGMQEQALSYKQNYDELKNVWGHIKTPDDFAKEKTFDGYMQAAMHAYKVTKERKLDKPVYVGPEIGMAGASYGSHPSEFIELIKGARNRMTTELMTTKGMDQEQAKSLAKQHIKGMMDTTHLSRWYRHMDNKPGESDADKLKRFNKWMKKWAKKMVEEDVVGGIQVVDSMTGEHSHLPAGQGIFDMVGLVKDMKEEGFKGDIVSEGHEEEGYGRGRILTETWRAFGSPIGSAASGAGGLNTFGGMQSSYFSHTLPTTYVVGGYAPSPEWTLWSETPME